MKMLKIFSLQSLLIIFLLVDTTVINSVFMSFSLVLMKTPSPHEKKKKALLLPLSRVRNAIPHKKVVLAIKNNCLQIPLHDYHAARLVSVQPETV